MERIEVGGLTIAFDRAGTGPPVVLLHGYVGDGRSVWQRQIDALSGDHTVIAWDAPGAGASSDPPERFGIEGYAECLARFIQELAVGPVHLIGLSFGGTLALALQRRHGSLTSSLVLASAYAGWRGSLAPEVAEGRLAQALRLSTLSPRGFVDALLPTMFAMPVPPQDLEAYRRAMERFHPAGFRAMAVAAAEDLSDVPPTVTAPTLLLYGSHDERAPLHVAEQLHAAIPRSRLVVLEGAGHVCNIEVPERFNDEVKAFVRDVG